MVLERPDRFLGHRIGQTGIAEPDHGLEGVREAAQVAALAIREAERSWHLEILPLSRVENPGIQVEMNSVQFR